MDTNDESSSEFMSRLDRDGLYRVTALQCATTRANLREHIGEDKVEVTVWADFFYHWLKGNGDGHEGPQLEDNHEPPI